MQTRQSFIKLTLLILFSVFSAQGAQAKNCLWKVSSGTGTLYLQGSIHLLTHQHYPLAPAINAAYAASDTLVLEADMGEMMLPATQNMLMSQTGSPYSLKSILTPTTYKQLEAACKKATLPIGVINQSKPWFAMTTLSMIKLQSMGFAPQFGLDQHFYTRATADHKPVIGLETVKFQINLFNSLSETDPNDFVNQALAELALIEEQLGALTSAWEAGDIDTLGTLMAESFKEYPELNKTFILDRNARWTTELAKLLQKNKTHMVVVGAGHLPGQGGLLELLKARGFKIEQL